MKASLLWTLLLSALIFSAFQRNDEKALRKTDAKAKKYYYLIPDFYDVMSRDSGDSLLVFECYDSSGKAIWQEDIHASFPK